MCLGRQWKLGQELGSLTPHSPNAVGVWGSESLDDRSPFPLSVSLKNSLLLHFSFIYLLLLFVIFALLFHLPSTCGK